MYNIGEPSMPPLVAQWAVIDQSTAVMASYQIVIALLMRERLGIRQKVDVSLLDTVSYIEYLNNFVTLLAGREMPKFERASADPMRNYYRCQDDKWIAHNQPPGEEKWQTVYQLLGYPELIQNPRYNSRLKRIENSTELVAIFDKAFATKTRDEWIRIFNEKNLVACAVNTTTEAINDPQMIANDYIVDFEHSVAGLVVLYEFCQFECTVVIR